MAALLATLRQLGAKVQTDEPLPVRARPPREAAGASTGDGVGGMVGGMGMF